MDFIGSFNNNKAPYKDDPTPWVIASFCSRLNIMITNPKDEYIADLFAKPNNHDTSCMFWFKIFLSLESEGNAYIFNVKNKELWYVPPSKINISYTKGIISSYGDFKTHDIIHLKYPHHNEGYLEGAAPGKNVPTELNNENIKYFVDWVLRPRLLLISEQIEHQFHLSDSIELNLEGGRNGDKTR